MIDTEDLLRWKLKKAIGLITTFNQLLLLLEPKQRKEKTLTDIGTNVIVLTRESL